MKHTILSSTGIDVPAYIRQHVPQLLSQATFLMVGFLLIATMVLVYMSLSPDTSQATSIFLPVIKR
ncbi:MAG: hypothetical protein AAF639_19115 [Chloroflexota bacterium]